ncbi:MAG: hypothetical protein EXX96DRAFT_566476 [Benjaminiella poitrasii]|nr:MAG: hypothetical protein EXX96DRAFT_566476 [Benjaminiella poitrasii]
MSRSLVQSSFNQEDLANEWEKAFHTKNHHLNNSHNKRPNTKLSNPSTSSNVTFKQFNAIFSDDEDDQPHGSYPPHLLFQQENQSNSHYISSSSSIPATIWTGYLDPLLSSSTYHIHQADNALLTLKHVISKDDGWKKALKHKSGVIVHMKNGTHKGDKTPIFKGEAIIQGFSPQAIFYVIGMRKLWDEQYEDGNLVENLNDTTSLTYEVMKPTTTNKPRDLALVEKIECTHNGAIIFACTSVESSKIPRINGRARTNIKLQGWILEPLYGGIQPATKVTFVIQESMKGWVPGFAKKALARRPLVIAKVSEYLEKKTERMRTVNKAMPTSQNINNGYSRRPSAVVSNHTYPHYRITSTGTQHLSPHHHSLSVERPSPNVSQNSILLTSQQEAVNTTSSNATITVQSTKKHISFAGQDNITHTTQELPKYEEGRLNSNSSTKKNDLSLSPSPPPTTSLTQNQKHNSLHSQINPAATPRNQHLYPSHRHPIQKIESLQLLKKLAYSYENWSLTKELEDGTKHYIFNAPLLSDDEEPDYQLSMTSSPLQSLSASDADEKRKVPFIRADGVINGGWTAEQICSITHCFGARKIWDSSFEGGQTVERFSQKEYLDQWFLGSIVPIASMDLSVITSIETDPITGTVYTASTSVTDHEVPPDESGHRIRAYTDLYGWVFRPKIDKNGRTLSVNVSFICNMDFKYQIPSQALQTWADISVQSITHLHRYLAQYGCPPYIRRVAGKVVQEKFDALGYHYEVNYIAKHQPSNAYRARKQATAVWCTDIRFHQKMFPDGFDIRLSPANVVRIQVSQQLRDQKSLKIFTTDKSIDGKQITLSIIPLSTTTVSEEDRKKITELDVSYRYNGELFFLDKLQKNKNSLPCQTTSMDISKEENYNTKSVDSQINPIASSDSIEILQSSQDITDSHSFSTIDSNLTSVSKNKNIKKKEEKENRKESLPIPKGYVLVPEHQNNNVIIITDELSFNVQQVTIMLLAMVICYYLGKFTSCNSC